MKTKFKAFVVALCAAFGVFTASAAEWTYDGTYMTTADGWKIQASVISGTTNLKTADNGGMVKAFPATGDLDDGKAYTLDLSGTITDAKDPTKTYTLTTIGFYAFNGCNGATAPFPVKINAMVLPASLTTWRLDSSVGVFGRNPGTLTSVLPRHFTHDITWEKGTSMDFGAPKYTDELHMNGIKSTGNCGLTFTHGGIQRLFFYSMFNSLNSTTFANSGSTRYDMYFRGDLPSGIENSGYGTGSRGLVHYPDGNATWTTWLASNARAFADSDKATFESKFPGYAYPEYVITVGKFNGGFATAWNATPGVTVTGTSEVGGGVITPAYGTTANMKTGTELAFSAPASVTEGGVEYVCEGYTIETTETTWAAATKVTSTDRSFTLVADDAKMQRVTWQWKAQVSASVTVSSNKGNFGTVDPGYGTTTSFPGDTKVFTAALPGYEDSTSKRYCVTGYKLTDKDGVITEHVGTSFEYDTSMGQVSIEWQWSHNGYRLTTTADGYLGCTVVPALDAQGYGDKDATYTLTGVDRPNEPFCYWSGNISGLDCYSREISVSLTKPMTLVATPKCNWHFTGDGNAALTNVLGWQVKAWKTGATGIWLGQDCARVGSRLAWNLDGEKATYFLDLAQPIVRDSDGEVMTITKSSNVPFRRVDDVYLAKLILPETYLCLSFDSDIFGNQSYLKEITPAPLPNNLTSSYGNAPYFGRIPYQGDVYLLTPAVKSIGNCGICFSHYGTQNIYYGTNFTSFCETSFAWSYANYRMYFKSFPTVPSGRNWSGDYRFYVRYPANNAQWTSYVAANARKFTEADKADFTARFPEDAAAEDWPKLTFTNGFYNATWAKALPASGMLLLVR